MKDIKYDIIIIGCGSAGLSVGLFMSQVGLKVLMVSKTDHNIGGDCLNDGCVPSKAIIHVAKTAHMARQAEKFGMVVSGIPDLKKALAYVTSRQEIIREHENASWLISQGIDMAIGMAKFTGKNEIEVDLKKYTGKKIIIATGSKPKKLSIAGVENVTYFDNENIFKATIQPKKLLVIGGGPIGIEIAQAMKRLGSNVTVIHTGKKILEHDDNAVTDILLEQLKNEGILFYLNATIEKFNSSNEAIIKLADGIDFSIEFDAVFVAIGRSLNIEMLDLVKANVKVSEGKILINDRLQTTNKVIFVCGDVAGDLQFSHAAEFHARILLNNFFSPLKKKLNNDHMSWVTFTDPELASFGLNEKELISRKIKYKRIEQDFKDDDRAIVDDYQYAKMILFIEQKRFFKKQKILGGTMVAPNAGELIQELILANVKGISIEALFNKIYPYPVATRINQKVIVNYKQLSLTGSLKKILTILYKIFN